MSKQLPEGWKWVKLGDVTKIIMGQSPPSTTYNNDENGLPFFQGKAEFTDLYPIVRIWCDAPKKLAEPNDILLSVRAPVGTTNLANQKCCIGRGLAAIRFKNYKYAFYFLRSRQQELDSKGTGTTFRAISGETLRETLFPLPSEEIQQAIVSKIEELFSELDKGIENLKTAQAQLKVYRQSVLKCAFEGKLTNGLNPDLKDLIDVHDLAMVAEPQEDYGNKANQSNHNNQKNHSVGNEGLPVDWKVVKIEQVINKLDQGWSPKCLNEASTDENEWAVIKTSAIQHGYFQSFENKILPKNLIPKEQHELVVDDILITRAGPRVRVGVCCLVRKTRKRLINCDKVYRIKLKQSIIKPQYFELVLNSPEYQRIIEQMKSGISDSGLNISQNKFIKVEIPLPPLDIQNQIVQEIESRLSVADKMEETIQQSLLQAESLRQSILKKAFEGELVK